MVTGAFKMTQRPFIKVYSTNMSRIMMSITHFHYNLI